MEYDTFRHLQAPFVEVCLTFHWFLYHFDAWLYECCKSTGFINLFVTRKSDVHWGNIVKHYGTHLNKH